MKLKKMTMGSKTIKFSCSKKFTWLKKVHEFEKKYVCRLKKLKEITQFDGMFTGVK
jgi:hypothetical protein